MIEIKEMREEDLDEIVRIEKETFSLPWSKKGFLDSLRADNTVYLTAWADGRIAGYCGFLQVLDEADITNVAVDCTCRNRGVGTAMLKALMQAAAQKGVEALTLEVRKSNIAALSLYEKLGFAKCGVRKNFYEKPAEDAVIMWKR